jgi:hypothetical protein
VQQLTYQNFGEAFIQAAVTAERVVTAVKQLAGDTIALGPMRAGPIGAAIVTARGTLGQPIAEPVADVSSGELLSYSVRIPVDLSIRVRVGAVGQFYAVGEIEMRLVVRTVAPLSIFIDVEPVTASDVQVEIRAKGVPSKVLQRAGDIEGELCQRAADYANARISDPASLTFRNIDLIPVIERTWTNL